MYSMSFAYEQVISNISKLSNNQSQWRMFKSANRLAVLLIIYNDAFLAFKSKGNVTTVHDDTWLHKLRSDASNGTYKCGELLFNSGIAHNQVRSVLNDTTRNNLMSSFISNAGSDGKARIYNLCNLLASNFYALEAYVSYGSILEMLTLQNVIKYNSFKKKANANFAYNLNQDAIIDSLLMNFAYGVEHFCHSVDSSRYGKFAKYMARVYRVAKMLSNKNERECWINLYTDIISKDYDGIESIVDDETKRKIAVSKVSDIKKKIEKTLMTNVDSFTISNKFINEGYNCVKNHLKINS